MKQYSVIFLRPKYFYDNYQEVPYGKGTYIAEVVTEDIKDAINIGREEVYLADVDEDIDGSLNIHRMDYKVLMVFEGHPKVALYGWQTEE